MQNLSAANPKNGPHSNQINLPSDRAGWERGRG